MGVVSVQPVRSLLRTAALPRCRLPLPCMHAPVVARGSFLSISRTTLMSFTLPRFSRRRKPSSQTSGPETATGGNDVVMPAPSAARLPQPAFLSPHARSLPAPAAEKPQKTEYQL